MKIVWHVCMSISLLTSIFITNDDQWNTKEKVTQSMETDFHLVWNELSSITTIVSTCPATSANLGKT